MRSRPGAVTSAVRHCLQATRRRWKSPRRHCWKSPRVRKGLRPGMILFPYWLRSVGRIPWPCHLSSKRQSKTRRLERRRQPPILSVMMMRVHCARLTLFMRPMVDASLAVAHADSSLSWSSSLLRLPRLLSIGCPLTPRIGRIDEPWRTEHAVSPPILHPRQPLAGRRMPARKTHRQPQIGCRAPVRYRCLRVHPNRRPQRENRYRRARSPGPRRRLHPKRRPQSASQHRLTRVPSRRRPRTCRRALTRKYRPGPGRRNHLLAERPRPATPARPTTPVARPPKAGRKSRPSEMRSKRDVSSRASSPFLHRLTRTTENHRRVRNLSRGIGSVALQGERKCQHGFSLRRSNHHAIAGGDGGGLTQTRHSPEKPGRFTPTWARRSALALRKSFIEAPKRYDN